jgi:hypothetical protein
MEKRVSATQSAKRYGKWGGLACPDCGDIVWIRGTGKEKQGMIRKRLVNSIDWECRLPYSCPALRR